MPIILNNNQDIEAWVFEADPVPMFERNEDFSGIYDSVNISVSNHCPYGPDLIEGAKINFYRPVGENSELIYIGYIDNVERSNFYTRKITIRHIFQKLKEVRSLNGIADPNGVFRVNQYLQEIDENGTKIRTLKNILEAIVKIATGNENEEVEDGDGSYNAEISGVNIFDVINTIRPLDSPIKWWGQDYDYNPDVDFEDRFTNDPTKAPTLWDILKLLTLTIHFAIIPKDDGVWQVTGLGHFRVDSLGELPTYFPADFNFVSLKLNGSFMMDEYVEISKELIDPELLAYQIEEQYYSVSEGDVSDQLPIGNEGDLISSPKNVQIAPKWVIEGSLDTSGYPMPYRVKYENTIYSTDNEIKGEITSRLSVTSVYARWVYPVIYNGPIGFYPLFKQPAKKYITRKLESFSIVNSWKQYFPLYLGYDFIEKKYILNTMELISNKQVF